MGAGGEIGAGYSKETMLVDKACKMSRTSAGKKGRVRTGGEHRLRKEDVAHVGILKLVGSAGLCSAEWVTRFISGTSTWKWQKANPN